MADRLAGKVAVVTGAANGIGRGCAELFAAERATVIGIDRAECDLLDEAAVGALFAAIGAEHGRIDILLNAAAFAVFDWIVDLSYADWKATLAGELDIVFLATRAAWPLLKASAGASVINFASANAAHALEGSPALAHCAGKGGVLAMTPAAGDGRRAPRHPRQHDFPRFHPHRRDRAAPDRRPRFRGTRASEKHA